eukprot:9495940-Pyramimonas_sp.AAC.3
MFWMTSRTHGSRGHCVRRRMSISCTLLMVSAGTAGGGATAMARSAGRGTTNGRSRSPSRFAALHSLACFSMSCLSRVGGCSMPTTPASLKASWNKALLRNRRGRFPGCSASCSALGSIRRPPHGTSSSASIGAAASPSRWLSGR